VLRTSARGVSELPVGFSSARSKDYKPETQAEHRSPIPSAPLTSKVLAYAGPPHPHHHFGPTLQAVVHGGREGWVSALRVSVAITLKVMGTISKERDATTYDNGRKAYSIDAQVAL
jgi:hypothetical protein